MNERYLTLEQNVCAARVFLNTFGFILEDSYEINEFSKLRIFDKNMDVVGELYFDNGQVMMFASYKEGMLKGHYDIAQLFGFVDIECQDADFALFGQWSSNIFFELHKGNSIMAKGEFLIECSIDTEFGITCLCHPLIGYKVMDKGDVTLKILRDGLTFDMGIKTDDCYETIRVSPWDDLNGYLIHDIRRRNRKDSYYYRRYSGIFNGVESGENRDKLHVFLKEREFNTLLNYHNEFVSKVNKGSITNLVIQKGLLMQELDSLMFQRIKELRKIMVIDDVSLFDNMISVCYDSYTDEELKALLDVDRVRMNYQDGADSLINAYYGIAGKSHFISPKSQKKLLKK